jgi:streptomycin 6-kinase
MFKFIPLTYSHLPLLVQWLNQPHVQKWYNHGNTTPVSLDAITKKMGPRIKGKEDAHGYIIEYNQAPIGYIQVYNARKFPRDGYELSAINELIAHIARLAAIDLYIGDPNYIGKGLGSQIIKQFMHDIASKEFDAYMVDPDMKNTASIRAFEKAGFKEIAKLTLHNGEQVKIMLRITSKGNTTDMRDIDDIIQILCNTWKLKIKSTITAPPANNYVGIAYSEKYQCDVILKILTADTHEPEALKVFNGNRCVKLLDYDKEAQGLLLEYIQPGTTLKSYFPKHDMQALKITADLIKKLHTTNHIDLAKAFKTVADWVALLSTYKSNRIPDSLIGKAWQLSQKLLSSHQELYLLHGDLHHENILNDGTQWVAIDPKGIVGPLEYEVGRFIMNPIPDLLEEEDAQDTIKDRIDGFSNIFGFDKQTIIEWLFVQAVLSACWTEEGGSEEFFNYFMKLARITESL